MATCLQQNLKLPFNSAVKTPSPTHALRLGRIRCATTKPSRRYPITLLPDDGIGPKVIFIAKNFLHLPASLEVGGSALDLTGVPLPEKTLNTAKQSDAVLLGAIGVLKGINGAKMKSI